MDDISEMLAGVLNDPESMEKVRKMAESVLGSNKETNEQQNMGDIGDMLSPSEMQNIISIISKLKSQGNDPRSQLLMALKPHLSEPRREKVDTAIKILKMLELLPLLKEGGILKL